MISFSKIWFCSSTLHVNVFTSAHVYRTVDETQVETVKYKVGKMAVGQWLEIIVDLSYELQKCLNTKVM